MDNENLEEIYKRMDTVESKTTDVCKELCKRMDTVESKTTDGFEKLSSDIAEIKAQLLQVPKTESQPQTLTPGVNESFFPSRQLLGHPLEERGSSDMETWLKKEFTDQMVLLGNRYFNFSDTNELITKVGTGLESYFHSIAPPPQSLSEIDYESLSFLNSNEAEKHLYSLQSIINFVSNDFEKSKPLWMRFDYLLERQEVGTEMVTEFCEHLRASFHKGICIYTPFEWSSYCTKLLKKKSMLDVDKYDMVLIPIIESGHYFSIHIHVKDRCIYILDPLYVNINEDHRKHLTYVVNILIGSKKFLDNAWNSYFVKNNPKQENAFDCGIYVAKYIEYWGKNEKLPFNKEQRLVARHIFVWETVHKKFMDLKYLPDA